MKPGSTTDTSDAVRDICISLFFYMHTRYAIYVVVSLSNFGFLGGSPVGLGAKEKSPQNPCVVLCAIVTLHYLLFGPLYPIPWGSFYPTKPVHPVARPVIVIEIGWSHTAAVAVINNKTRTITRDSKGCRRTRCGNTTRAGQTRK